MSVCQFVEYEMAPIVVRGNEYGTAYEIALLVNKGPLALIEAIQRTRTGFDVYIERRHLDPKRGVERLAGNIDLQDARKIVQRATGDQIRMFHRLLKRPVRFDSGSFNIS